MIHEDLSNQEKLEEIYKMTLENNKLLRGMRSREKIANTFRIIYWLVIIGAIGGAFYIISPILNSIVENKNKIQDTLQEFNTVRANFPETKALNSLLDSFKNASTSSTTTSN